MTRSSGGAHVIQQNADRERERERERTGLLFDHIGATDMRSGQYSTSRHGGFVSRGANSNCGLGAFSNSLHFLA
jgi:hypothetical protein